MLFSCYKVARIIAFVQCLQADIAPFIIHAENKEEYEGRLDSPARLEQLFGVERWRFYRVCTVRMVVDQCISRYCGGETRRLSACVEGLQNGYRTFLQTKAR